VKFKSQIITEASGSVGGATYSHNRGGLYIRARAIPTNPNSPEQQAVRSIMADLTTKWSELLDAAEREAWDTYALNVPLPDTLGEPRNVGGLGMYVRSNLQAIQALGSSARLDVAPIVFDLGSFTQPSIAVTGLSGIAVTFDVLDSWYVDGGRMFVSGSRPQNASRNYFKGPYRFTDSIVSPDTSPHTAGAPFSYAVGQRVFVQLRVRQLDGRISLPIRLTGIVT
jgi:hypothetical protein